MKALYALHKDENQINRRPSAPLKAGICIFDMESSLVNLAQRQLDLEDEEYELTNKVAALVSCQKSRQAQQRPVINQLHDQIEAELCHLK